MTEPAAGKALTIAVDLRPFMARFPSGVSIITAVDGDIPWGMTCTSLCSVSLDPPVILMCLRQGSPTLRAVLGSGAFSVNLLGGSARATASLFASGAPDRFERVPWYQPYLPGGPHLIADAMAVADCLVAEHKQVGTHTVVFGEVQRVTAFSDSAPLLYGQRQFTVWNAA
jgi:flavin reductase (DIM6/NTAB) family NADH-FMN oxidoreductase RutF